MRDRESKRESKRERQGENTRYKSFFLLFFLFFFSFVPPMHQQKRHEVRSSSRIIENQRRKGRGTERGKTR